MSLDFKDITAEVSIGDLLSPKSSASSHPIQSLNFAPVWSLVMGSPDTAISPKSEAAQSPSIDAPVTDYRPVSQAMSGLGGGTTPAQLTGQTAPKSGGGSPSMLAGWCPSKSMLAPKTEPYWLITLTQKKGRRMELLAKK